MSGDVTGAVRAPVTLMPLVSAEDSAVAGDKAARLAAAARAGLPVLPGWAVPCAAARPALNAGAAAVSNASPASARRAALSCPLEKSLASELAAAVRDLGGRVIVRSSSPLERDLRWSGAFSSVAEVGVEDVATAVRSCWASAFAADPLERLRACGLPVEDLEMGVVIQPELRPDAGGTATVGPGFEVTAEAVAGHPGPLLAGWAEGVSGPGLAALIGGRAARRVAGLAVQVRHLLGEDTIEWAIQNGLIWLLQSRASAARFGEEPAADTFPAPDTPSASPLSLARDTPSATRPLPGPDTPLPSPDTPSAALLPSPDTPSAAPLHAPDTPSAAPLHSPDTPSAAPLHAPDIPDIADMADMAAVDGSDLGRREWMPLLAATVRAGGERLPARPAAPGLAAGRLVYCRPHERPPASAADAILLVDRPVPALAPLLFGARGLIARTGAASSHLAEVARSLAVPMVTGCQVPDGSSGSDRLAAVDGTSGEVALLSA